ncbi:MAG: site-specific integrase, partial [Pirellulaceae bacterium]
GPVMSYQKLTSMLKSAKPRPNDRLWFGRWVDGYRRFCRVGPNDSIPINRESVIGFLRQQKAGGKQAWQRLQMVKAIQFCQTAVPRTHAPPLDDIREKLNEFARQHPVAMSNNSSVIDVAGQIDPNEPEPIQQFRWRLRLLGREYSTEKAYVKWARQFAERYQVKSVERLKGLGEAEVTRFLTDLAVDRNVAAGTQNQAFNALLKLFEYVAEKELHAIEAVRATKPKKLPLVLSHDEIERLLAEFHGRNRLFAQSVGSTRSHTDSVAHMRSWESPAHSGAVIRSCITTNQGGAGACLSRYNTRPAGWGRCRNPAGRYPLASGQR